MRCLARFELGNEAASRGITDGTLPKVMQQVMEAIKPEASYFTVENGNRCALMFFDMSDSSDMPLIAEPAFMNLDAKISFTPVMNLDELQRGLAKLG